jgi:hypothetical protein
MMGFASLSMMMWILHLVQYSTTPKNQICCVNRKFGLCSNRPKTVLRTDLTVKLTEKSVVPNDFVRCLKKVEVVKTTDIIYVLKTDVSVKATDRSVRRTVFGWLARTANFSVVQQILFFGIDQLWGEVGCPISTKFWFFLT